MNTVNAYEALYANMKNRFTVVNDSNEYSLGEYMLMKAGKKKESSNLPATKSCASNSTAITAFFKYVNDKLTVKKPPVKDKIIKRFPFRTSAAALMSAVVACTLLITYGTVSIRSVTNDTPTTIHTETSDTERTPDYTFSTKN